MKYAWEGMGRFMYHIIVNPAAQSGKGLKIWEQKVEPVLQQEGVEYRCYFSKEPGDLGRLAATVTEGNLVVIGGDGAINEVLQGMTHLKEVTLSCIPVGSGNDLVRALRIPTDPVKAARRILHTAQERPMDLGTVRYPDGQERHFIVSCGIGFDADVCEQVNRTRLKGALNLIGLGKLTYLGVAIRQIFCKHRADCMITIDGERMLHRDRLLFVAGMNHAYEGGGFKFAPYADDCDGVLDLCIVAHISIPKIFAALPTAILGKHFWFKGVDADYAHTFAVQVSEPLWVHTDGEVSRRTTSFSVQCRRGVLRFL